MKVFSIFITCLVILTLAAGASASLAQEPAQAAPSSLAFSRLFMLDPMTSYPNWHSHTVMDASGGAHMTFYDSTNIYYAHCAAGCSDPANWLELPLFQAGNLDSLDEPTLLVDASGRPRLVWYADYSGAEEAYYYAECNSNCANSSANWDAALVTQIDSYGYPHHNRFAALDNLNRPHLVYQKSDYPDYGFFYLSCDGACTNASSWYTTTVVTPGLEPYGMQLAFDPGGRPRVFGYEISNDSLFYAECNSGCSAAANWGSVGLFSPIYNYGDSDYALRVDAQGRPRVAYYAGDTSNNVLYYAWSNGSPLTVGGWSSYTLSYPSRDDWSLDLALDSQGRPSVAYSTAVSESADDGLAYLTCSAACETASPTWQAQFIETTAELENSYPIATNPDCVSSVWMVFGYPSLALDGVGSPSVSYRVQHAQLCYDNYGHLQTLYDAGSIRFATSGGAPVDTRLKLYLPVVIR